MVVVDTMDKYKMLNLVVVVYAKSDFIKYQIYLTIRTSNPSFRILHLIHTNF